MRCLFLTLCLVLSSALSAQATTYYIDDAGSDAAAGTSTGTAWLTWAHAFTNTACGDTLIVMDGTFTNTSPVLTKACTVGNPYTIRAENQRQARIADTNGGTAFSVLNCTYCVIDGLRVSSANYQANPNGYNIEVRNGHHNHVLNTLVQTNNKYGNNHMLGFVDSPNGLVEGNELYDYTRHGIFIHDSDNSVVRRNYCHSRGAVTPVGGFNYPSTDGDSCVAIYPSENITVENNISDGPMGKAYTMQADPVTANNNYYGNIALNPKIGMSLDVRRAGAANMPTNTYIKDMVIVGANFGSVGGESLRSVGAKNTQCVNCSVIGSGANNTVAFSARDFTNFGDGLDSFFVTNSLAYNNASATGFNVNISGTTAVNTWTLNYNSSFGNLDDYNPNPDNANITNEIASNPTLGDCFLWLPDASPLKGAGLGGADVGATILYRYVDGILTTTPLWDPTTGEFPHGAIIAGLNDSAGDSAFDVHKRLNVPFPGDTHGCNFPASFAGGGTPTNPATHVSSTGVSSTSHSHTFDAGIEKGVVFVHLRDSASNVGSVSTVTGCGGEAYTLRKRQTNTPTNPFHAVEIWTRDSPTSGVCTMAVSTSGAVTSMVTTSIEVDGVHATTFGAAEGAGGFSSTPTVTVGTEANAVILSATSGTSGGTISAGASQTLQTDTVFAPSRLAVSQQSGTNGGVMDYLFNAGNTNWATAAISFCPLAGCAGATNILTVTKYGIFSGLGTEAGSAALAATSTAASIAPTGSARVRAEITTSVSTTPPFGFSLYCQKTSEGVYRQIVDTLGSSVVRLYGPGVDPSLPSSQTPTTPRLTAPDGNSVAGVMLRDAASVWFAPQMASGKKIEMEWVIVANATAGDTIDCQPRFDSGVALNAYTVTPRLTIIPPAASGVAQADQPTGLSVNLDPFMPRWPLVGSLGDASKNF
jgi:parallel beta-helix repeat protein